MNKESVTHVTPAILPKTFEELEEKLAVIAPMVSWVQIDAADGIFVPNRTWPYDNDTEDHFNNIIKQEESFPNWEDVSFEIDLMVANPVFEADKWIAAGASRLVIHIKSISLEQFEVLAKNIKEKGIELVLGVEMSVPMSEIHKYIVAAQENGELESIQCMGIRREGFQHQKLDSGVYKKLEELRAAYPDIILSVDGGVNLEDAGQLHASGATRLVCGSTIFDSASPEKTIEEIEDILS